ncbi:MAG: hypothetical protein AAGJ81_15785 [Verrucomicrobiota bacterium]
MKLFSEIIVFLIFGVVTGLAQSPSSSEIYSQVESLWNNNQMVQLDQYLEDLIDQNPDYAPAITASSFHDAIFKGKLPSAKQKLESIKNDASANSGKYSDEFIEAVEGLIEELDHEIDMHARHGITDATLEANASAIAVRAAWGNDIPIQILIIEIANEVTL